MNEFYPRTVLSGAEYGAGITVNRVRLGEGLPYALMLVPCGRTGIMGKGRMLWPDRAQVLRDAITEALR